MQVISVPIGFTETVYDAVKVAGEVRLTGKRNPRRRLTNVVRSGRNQGLVGVHRPARGAAADGDGPGRAAVWGAAAAEGGGGAGGGGGVQGAAAGLPLTAGFFESTELYIVTHGSYPSVSAP